MTNRKVDSFGVVHARKCKAPSWATAYRGQICTSCGVRWHHGKGSTAPQPRQGYDQ